MSNEPTENFLQELYRLAPEPNARAGLSALARKLGVTPAAVAQMAPRLAVRGLLRRHRREGLSLSAKGRAAALRLIRHHRLAERFFTDVLGLSLEQAHVEAHRLEHVISDEVGRRLDALLGHPERCPCGDPIPSRNGQVREDRDLVSLNDLPEGARAVIVRVSEEDSRILRYVETLRLVPGARLSVARRTPVDGVLTLKTGKGERVIGSAVASRIYVRRDGARPPVRRGAAA